MYSFKSLTSKNKRCRRVNISTAATKPHSSSERVNSQQSEFHMQRGFLCSLNQNSPSTYCAQFTSQQLITIFYHHRVKLPLFFFFWHLAFYFSVCLGHPWIAHRVYKSLAKRHVLASLSQWVLFYYWVSLPWKMFKALLGVFQGGILWTGLFAFKNHNSWS